MAVISPSFAADLIARLQVATCSSVRLDRDLAQAFGAETCVHGRMGYAMRDVPWLDYDTSRWGTIPRFTHTVDDAVRLLSGNFWIVSAGKTRPDELLYGARVMAADYAAETVLGEGESDASPAIALCIAAVRASEARPC